MCQEAADIVTGDCPALAEKMYNCSRLFEEDRIAAFYHRPNCEKVDVVKVGALLVQYRRPILQWMITPLASRR